LAAPRALFEEQAGCFVVRDASGRTLGYFYFAEETTETSFGSPVESLAASSKRRQSLSVALC
jgi:hypothetical protein